jgi:hypothetical protein
MTPAVRNRVRAAWSQLATQQETEFEPDYNPVEKAVLLVHRFENRLVIDELLTLANGNNDANGATDPLFTANQAAGNQQAIAILTNQVQQLRNEQTDTKMVLQTAISQLRAYQTHQFTQVHTTLGRMLAQAPTRRVARPANTATANITARRQQPQLRAGLSKGPKNLHQVWREWTDGLGGNKPASQLSLHERGGTLRYTYFNRKFIWMTIKRQTDKGISHLTAIENIQQAYGYGKSVSHYIACIKRDLKHGGHPNLTDV